MKNHFGKTNIKTKHQAYKAISNKSKSQYKRFLQNWKNTQFKKNNKYIQTPMKNHIYIHKNKGQNIYFIKDSI